MRVVAVRWSLFVLVCTALASVSHAADAKVEELKEAPTGLSAEVASVINETGYRVTGPDGVICDLWLAKEIPLKPKFKSSLRIKYPLLPGQLVGAIRFPDSSKPNDFRGQPLNPGTYTLRYGLQPDDGNHLGTSDIRDFLVGCPPKDDVNPKRVEDIKKLFKLSAGAAGTTHPAIFLLLPPPEKPVESPSTRHDDEKHLQIFEANLNGKDADAATPIPFSLVTVGKSDG
jgi:hypothetical protein